jgi:phosphate-selective porin OprO/OprP
MNKTLYKALMVSTLLASYAMAADKDSTGSKDLKTLKSKVAALEKKVNAKEEKGKLFNFDSEKLKIGFDGEFQASKHFKQDTGKSFGTFVNTAKVTIQGRLAPEWAYHFAVDFANEKISTKSTDLNFNGTVLPNFEYVPDVSRGTSVKSAHIRFYGFNPVIIAVGRLFPDLSIDRGEMFLESPAVSAIFPINRNGAYIGTHGDNWYVSTTLTHSGGTTTTSDDEESNLTWYRKVAFVPYKSGDKLLHVGGSWVSMIPKTSKFSTTDFNQRPENTLGAILVGTGFIDNIRRSETFMADVAYNHGPLLLSGEYARAIVKRASLKSSKFDGWYAQASYTLTGESCTYDMASPSFSDITPNKPFDLANGNYGAFEATYRYSTVNFGKSEYGGDLGAKLSFLPGVSSDGGVATLDGGKMMMHTLGINWIPNTNLMFMLNYSFGKVKNSQVWGTFYQGLNSAPEAKLSYSPKIIMFKAKVKV